MLLLSVGRPPGRDWKRRPGRPRTRWIDQVQRDSITSPVELWRHAVYDVVILFIYLKFSTDVYKKWMDGVVGTQRPYPATRL